MAERVRPSKRPCKATPSSSKLHKTARHQAVVKHKLLVVQQNSSVRRNRPIFSSFAREREIGRRRAEQERHYSTQILLFNKNCLISFFSESISVN